MAVVVLSGGLADADVVFDSGRWTKVSVRRSEPICAVRGAFAGRGLGERAGVG